MENIPAKMAFYSNYEMASYFVKIAHKENVVILLENAGWLAKIIENPNGAVFGSTEEMRHLKRQIACCDPDIAIITLDDKNRAQEILRALVTIRPDEHEQRSCRIGLFMNGKELL